MQKVNVKFKETVTERFREVDPEAEIKVRLVYMVEVTASKKFADKKKRQELFDVEYGLLRKFPKINMNFHIWNK